MRYLSILLFLSLISGCHTSSEEVSSLYNHYTFDQKVIDKLPLYDSLATAILQNFSFCTQHMNGNESYRAFRYIPSSEQPEVYIVLPKEIAAGIEPYYSKIGKDFIYGFDVFKDSTIKMYIRNISTKESQVNIEENLSYYPVKNKIRSREFPIKDTLLNLHWQYWTRFDTPRFF